MLPLKVWPNHYIQPYQPCSKANIRKIFNNSPCPFLIFLPPHVGRSLLWMAEERIRRSGETWNSYWDSQFCLSQSFSNSWSIQRFMVHLINHWYPKVMYVQVCMCLTILIVVLHIQIYILKLLKEPAFSTTHKGGSSSFSKYKSPQLINESMPIAFLDKQV